jgi:hypothetical protein
MKFYYSVIIFLLNLFIFFWLYIFLIPAPRVQTADKIIENPTLTRFLELTKTLDIVKENPGEKIHYLDLDIQEKKYNAVFLYCLLTFVTILIVTIFFHKRSYVIFPMIASIVFSLIACSVLWLFTTSISKNVYLDIQATRDQYLGVVNIVKFLGIFLFVDLFVIIFGFWYDFPE